MPSVPQCCTLLFFLVCPIILYKELKIAHFFSWCIPYACIMSWNVSSCLLLVCLIGLYNELKYCTLFFLVCPISLYNELICCTLMFRLPHQPVFRPPTTWGSVRWDTSQLPAQTLTLQTKTNSPPSPGSCPPMTNWEDALVSAWNFSFTMYPPFSLHWYRMRSF